LVPCRRHPGASSTCWSPSTNSPSGSRSDSIITDNGTQFTGKKFLDFCEDHHIRVDWAVVAHPMTNGQVERANDMILQGLKPRIYNDLNKFGKRWIKELPSVV
jgi:transposase InsO family protein